jgi:hypothetical protein
MHLPYLYAADQIERLRGRTRLDAFKATDDLASVLYACDN